MKRIATKRAPAVVLLLLFGAAGAAAEDYTLARYLARVEERSRDLLLAGKEISQADLSFKQAQSALFPSVFARAGYNRNFLDVTQPFPVSADLSAGDPAPLNYADTDVNSDNEFSAGVAVSQALFNMKAYHALKFGREYTAVRRTQYEETRRSLLTAAKKTYFQAVLLNEIVKVKEASETTDRDNHRDVKRKFEAGAVPELDVLQAEVAWKTKIAETAQARKNLQVALVAMKTLAGMPPDAAAFPSEALAEVPPLPDAADPDRAAAARPDYELLLRGRRMAEIAVDLARADRYPAVSASLSYGYSAANDRFSAGGGTDVLQLGIKIDLPVYTGGAVSTNVEIEKISLEKSDIGLAKMRDAVAAEISQIRLSLEEAKQRIDSAKALVAVAEKAHALAKLSRENGLLTQLELGEASVQLENARIGRSAAVFDYLAAYFDWEKATGKP